MPSEVRYDWIPREKGNPLGTMSFASMISGSPRDPVVPSQQVIGWYSLKGIDKATIIKAMLHCTHHPVFLSILGLAQHLPGRGTCLGSLPIQT